MRDAYEILTEQSTAEHFYQSASVTPGSLTIFSIEALEAAIAKTPKRSRQWYVLDSLLKEPNLKPLRMVSDDLKHSIKALKAKFANFSEVIDTITKELLLASVAKDSPVRLAPILLVGPPGVGKTHFLNSLARVFNVPFSQVDMASMSAGFVLAGNSASWAEAKPGHVSDALRASPVANPIILLDELDKVSGNQDHDPNGSLYSLLERETAKTFVDECIGIPMNCSAIIWFASANYLEQIPDPIQSRMRVMHVDAPSIEMMPVVCKSIFEDLLSSNSWGQHFDTTFDESMCDALAALSPRKIKQTLYDACCNAVIRTGGGEAVRVEMCDIKVDEHLPRQKRIGFM